MKNETLEKANKIQDEIGVLNALLDGFNMGEIDYINIYSKDSKFYLTIDKNFIITAMARGGKREIADDMIRLEKQFKEL